MRNPERIPELLGLIQKYWEKYPDLRLCQLLSNVAKASGWDNPDLYYLEDDDLHIFIKLQGG